MFLKSVTWCSNEPIYENLSDTKVVWFVRHGQSTANTVGASAHHMTEYKDALLTNHGVQQAIQLQKTTITWSPDIIVTSPLRRAIQTSCVAFSNVSAPIVGNPLCTECFSGCQENIGYAPIELAKDPTLTCFPRFQDVQLKNIEDEWWNIDNTPERYQQFYNDLQNLSHRRIVVVSHWGFIYRFFKELANLEVCLQNCEWIRTTWAMETVSSRNDMF
jgi:broad specificity phosphatase PhoE